MIFCVLLLAACRALDHERLAQDRLNAHPRVERGVRILEHHLQVAAGAAQRPPAHAEDLLARELDPCRRRASRSPTISLPSVVLPQPDSPTSPSVSPASTCSVTSETALTEFDLALEDRARGDRVLAHDVRRSRADGSSVTSLRRAALGAGATILRVARSGPSTGCQQANRVARGPRPSAAAPRPGTARSRAGSAARSGSPAAGCVRSGGRPGMLTSASRAVLVEPRDRAEQRLRVGVAHGR